ncbi:hypothetical protein D3C73_1548300 [compost metagenome]
MDIKNAVCGTELPDKLDKSIAEWRADQHRAEEQFLRKLALLVEPSINKRYES